MAKTKSDNGAKAGRSSKAAEVKAISSVKEGAVTKPSQTPKAKSQEMAKHVAVKADKVNKESRTGEVVKEPTPESSSDESSAEEAATSESSESDGSDEDVPKSAIVTNGKANGKINGTAKVAAKPASESSDSSSSSDAEQAAKGVPAAEVSDDSDEDEDDDEDDSDESDESNGDAEPKAKGPVDAKALSGALKKVASEDVRV